jgi:3D (Asp-Asp-Asp) domain-containing protein
MILAHSGWRKATATIIAIGGFVALYDATMLDSKDVARANATVAPEPPQAGARLSFTATAYCKGAVTAAGVAAQAGVAAADPSLLPLGSVIELDSPDSRYDGIYSIVDTGPAVQGALIDIYIWSCHEALKFGRRPVRLTVLRLGWNPKATAPSFMDRLFRRVGQVVPSSTPAPRPAS